MRILADGRDDRPPQPLLHFPTPPPPGPPFGPLHAVGAPPRSAAPVAGPPPSVARPAPAPPPRHQFLVTLVDSDPLVWRRLAVPGTTTLARLHRVLQAVLGWTDSHLHRFVVGDTGYGDPELLVDDSPAASTRQATLGRVAPNVGAALWYEYDFGDGWRHLIVVERLLHTEPGAKGAICLAGDGACPPEDCGGIGGDAALPATPRRGRGEGYRELLAWRGGPCDPGACAPAATNRALRRLR